MKTRVRKGGFTLVEVMIALAIISLAAVVLLDRRVELVREAVRSRAVRMAWSLAGQKMAELELDKVLWTGTGGQSSGDFREIDPAYETVTWEYLAVREQVTIQDPRQPPDPNKPEKPRELFRLTLTLTSPDLSEPITLEAFLPVQAATP